MVSSPPPVYKGNLRCSPCSPGMCTNTSYCILCPEGTYSNQTNSTRCTVCPDGYIAKTKNTTKCNPCRAGETSSFAHTVCRACEPGTYNPKYCHLTPLSIGNGSIIFIDLTSRPGGLCLPCPTGQCQRNYGGKSCYPCAFPYGHDKVATEKFQKGRVSEAYRE